MASPAWSARPPCWSAAVGSKARYDASVQCQTVCRQDPMEESATVVGRFRRILQAREVKRNVWYSIDDQEIKECVYESFYDIVVPQDVLKVSCHLLFDSLQAGLDYDYFTSITFALIILP